MEFEWSSIFSWDFHDIESEGLKLEYLTSFESRQALQILFIYLYSFALDRTDSAPRGPNYQENT